MAIASAQPCNLCPQGEPPHNGNLVVYQIGDIPTTCNDIAQLVIGFSPELCVSEYAYAVQYICGCVGVKPGRCPGICESGSVLTIPDQPTALLGATCRAINQYLKGKPGDTTCPDIVSFNYKEVCLCKAKVPQSPNNMGGGGGGMIGMSGRRQLRNGGFEEHFLPHAACGLAM